MAPGKEFHAEDTFEVAPQAVERGRDYEKNVLVHFILTLLSNREITDFKISSNVKQYGAFDDVVLEVLKSNEDKVEFAIQLKHKINGKRTLTADGLDVRKYFEAWEKDLTERQCKLVLFVTVKANLRENQTVDFGDAKTKVKKAEIDALLDTSESPTDHCFRLLLEEGSEGHRNFLENFVIYSRQTQPDKLKSNASARFRELFECASDGSFENFYAAVDAWYSGIGRKHKIDKKWAMRTISVCLLFPQHIQLGSSASVGNCDLFADTIKRFHVTVVSKDMKQDVLALLQDATLSKSEFNGAKKYFSLAFLNFVENDNDIKKSVEASLVLWLLDKAPLVVVENPQVLKAIQISPLGNIILLSENPGKVKLENSFCNLSDLERQNREIYIKMIERLQVSLQGKKSISLKSLLEDHVQIASSITTKEIVSMLRKPFLTIGGEEEELPKSHIPQKLSVPLINIKYLQRFEENGKKVIIVLNCDGKKDKIKRYLEDTNARKIEDDDSVKSVTAHCVVYFEKKCPQRKFDEICSKRQSTSKVHHFRVCDDGHLEWLQSSNGISDLESFKSDRLDVDESELYKSPPENSVNVICAKPGMGKSTIAKSLKNNFSSRFWTVMMYPSDVSSFFREGGRFEDYVETKVRSMGELDLNVMRSFKEKRLLAFIWDGLDEISDQNFEKVLEIIEKLSKKGFLQWITARTHLQEKLEKKLSVFARIVKEFDNEQQDVYIRKRLNSTGNLEQTAEVINKIKNNIRLIQSDGILGIPLQIYMLTELFIQDVGKYMQLLKNIFSITDLYEHFVNEKFNRFFKEKVGIKIRPENDALEDVLESYKNSYVKKYQKSALRALFEDDLFQKFNVNSKKFLENVKLKRDAVGLITEVSENLVPTFLHNSYSEYFVAAYFCRNQRKIENLKEILFEERYSHVRFLFDLLMAHDCPAHIAVLYKNIEVLRKNKELIRKRDKGGRTPLHLACSWGERHPLLTTNQAKNEVDISLGQSSIEESDKQKEIMTFLLEICDSTEKDQLFKMDSLDYADSSLCLSSLFEISEKREINFEDLENYKDICTVIYYVIKFDKAHLITLITNFPSIRTKNRGRSVLHLCAEYNSVNCLKKLLLMEECKELVNVADIYGVPPLRTACKKGHTSILEILLEHDADLSAICLLLQVALNNDQNEIVETLIKYGERVNIKQKYRFLMYDACLKNSHKIVKFLLDKGVKPDNAIKNKTPLYIASQYNHIRVVQVLLEKGADVNAGAKTGFIPLHIACINNNLDIVKLLSQKADLNAFDKKGYTPLSLACKYQNEEVVDYLLGLDGVDVDIPNQKAQKPIHISCQNGNTRIVDMLIEAGTEVNSVCEESRTPLHYACEKGHLETVKLLCRQDAKKDVYDNNGNRPLDLAVSRNFQEIVDYLKATC